MATKSINQKPKQWRSVVYEVELPEGASAKYENHHLIVTGPKGQISKRLRYPNVKISVEGNKVILSTDKFSQREKKIMLTYRAHVKNLGKGVTEGFEYKLAVVFAKFPITVEMQGNTFLVKNLLGQKVPKSCEVPSDVKVEIKGKDVSVTGIDKERVGQVAARLEQLTRITHLDRRVIQDGLFIVEKPHRRYV